MTHEMVTAFSLPTPDFRILFESIPGLFLVLTPDLTIVAVSDAYLQATMTKRGEILGRGLFEVFPDNPNDPAATGVRNLRVSLERVLRDRTRDTMAVQKYDIPRPVEKGGGFEERYWSPLNSPVFGANGEVAYLIHRVEDVTEFVRMRQTAAHYEQESRLKVEAARQQISTILESITDAFVAFDRQWCYTYINQEAARLLRQPQAELIGRPIWEVFPDLVGGLFEREFRRAVDQQVTVEFEAFYQPFNIWVEVHAYPSETGLSVYFRDITAQKHAARRLAAQHAVTRVLAEAHTLADAIPTLLQSLCELGWQISFIWHVDRQTNVLRCIDWQAASITGEAFAAANQETTFAPGVGLPGRIWTSGQPIWIADLEDDNFPQAALAAREGLHSVFGFPIRLGNQVLGVIECFGNQIEEPDEALLQIVTAIGSGIGQFMERKRSEEALRESQALFECFMRNSPVTAFIKDESGRYIYVNSLLERLFKRPLADWLGKTDFDFFPSDLAQQYWENDKVVLTTGQALQVQETALFEDGEHHYLSFKFPLQDCTGRQMLAGMVLDLTERIRTETALRQSEERFRRIFECNMVGMGVWTQSGQIIEANEALLDLIGYTQQAVEAGRLNWRKLTPLEYTDLDDRALAEIQTKGFCTPFEKEYLHQNGQRIPILIGGATFADEPESGVFFALNLSDRKQIEQERTQLVCELQAVNALLDTLFSNAPIGIGIWDEKLRYVRLNEALAEINGLPIEAHIGKTVAELLPDVGEEVMKAFRHVVETGESLVAQEASGETPAAPGKHRYWSVNYYPIKLSDKITWVGALCEEITTRKQSEIALQERTRELTALNAALAHATTLLQERNQELDQFAYIVSHDLKAPLRAIANLSQWIEEDLEGQLPEENQQQMQLLRQRVHRMEKLINGLLEYSRIGRTKAVKETVNVAQLLTEVIDSLAPPSPFRIEIEPNMPTLTAERMPLSQVFANLIGNAFKHHDCTDGRVKIAVQEQSNYYQFTVADDGRGIAPEYHERIFAIFQTLGETDRKESTGIGLAIVKKIVERQGGVIDLESEVGQGTIFRFTWPK